MTPVPTPEAFDAWRRRPGFTWLLLHSRTSPVSAAALSQVEAYETVHPRDAIGLIVAEDDAAASNRATAAFRVLHQNPQLFLLKDGQVEWHAVQGGITQGAMEMQRLPGL